MSGYFFEQNVTLFNPRGTWDATTQYEAFDATSRVISGSNVGWLALTRPTAGVTPETANSGWVTLVAQLVTGPTGAQGINQPAPQVQYSDDNVNYRNNYVDGDEYRRVSYDGGANFVVERIRGKTGQPGQSITGPRGADGTNAPLVRWQYAAQPTDPDDPITWRDTYVAGDVWKHYSADGGNTWGVPERILGQDGRDGFDLERQYSASADGPWEVDDEGQAYVRERIGDIAPFGPAFQRTGGGGSGSGWTSASEAPSNPTDGQGWYDLDDNILRIFDGTFWNVASGYDHALFPERTATLLDELSFIDVGHDDRPGKTTIQNILDLGGFAVAKELFDEQTFWDVYSSDLDFGEGGQWTLTTYTNAVVGDFLNRAFTTAELNSAAFLLIDKRVWGTSNFIFGSANKDLTAFLDDIQGNGGVLYIHNTNASNYATIENQYFRVVVANTGNSKTGNTYKFAIVSVTQVGSPFNGNNFYAFSADRIGSQKVQAQNIVDFETLFAKAIPITDGAKLPALDTDGLVGSIDLDTLFSQYPKKVDLIGDDTADFYGDFQPASGFLQSLTTQRRGAWCLATNASGAPTASDSTNYNQVNDGNYTLVIGATMQTSDWKFRSAAFVASDFVSGDILYAHPYDPYDKDNYFKMTLTGNAVLVNTGNAAYLYAPVTVDEIGSIDDPSDGWRLTETPPTDILSGLRGRLPIQSTPELSQSSRLLLSTFNEVTIAHLAKHLRPDTTEDTSVSTTFETTNADIKNGNNLIGIQNPLINGTMALLWSLPASVNDLDGDPVSRADIEDRLNVHYNIKIFSGTKVIKGIIANFNVVTLPGATYHQINLQNATQAGSAFADGDSVTIRIKSNIVSRDEFSALAFGLIDNLTAETTAADDDLLAIWDTSAGATRKMTLADIKTYVNS